MTLTGDGGGREAPVGVSTTEMESMLMLKGKLSREPNTKVNEGDPGGADAERRSMVPLLRVEETVEETIESD